MDGHRLRLFLLLAKNLNFNRAAKQAHVSPSTLSRVIKQLEDELEVSLFTRNNRSVSLTYQGKKLQQFAADSLQDWENFREQLQQESALLRGSLSLFCSVTASYSFLYDILAQFRRTQPHIAITLHTGDPAISMDRVASGFEDIGIAARQDTMPYGLVFKKMTHSNLTLIAPQAKQRSFSENLREPDWNKIPFIFSEKGVTRERLEKWLAQQQITPNIYAQVAGHEAIVSMVSLGFGVGLVPQIVLDNSPLAKSVVALANPCDFGDYEVGICVLRKRLNNPIINEFWKTIGSD